MLAHPPQQQVFFANPIGQPQVYGSQIVRDPDNGQWMLHPIEDEANVNKRRAEIGMEPLEDYALRFGIIWKPK